MPKDFPPISVTNEPDVQSESFDDLDRYHNHNGEAPTLSGSDLAQIRFGSAAVSKFQEKLKKYGRMIGIAAVVTPSAMVVGWRVLQFVKSHHGAQTDHEALEKLGPWHFDEWEKDQKENGKKNRSNGHSPPKTNPSSPRFHIGTNH